MKKLIALVLAAVMMMTVVSVFAETLQGAATKESTVTLSGLDEGDIIKLYKVIGWEDSTGWKLESAFNTVTAFEGKLGTENKAISIDTGVVNEINSKITSSTATAGTYTMAAADNGSHTFTGLDVGMYIAIVTAAKPGVVYNPIIVSADFTDNGNTIDASHSSIPASSGAASAVAKKSKITLEKEGTDATTVDTNDKETVAVGDEVSFDIDSQIPPFATYIKPIYTITDELSDGITLCDVDHIVVTQPSGAVRGTDYTVTRDSDHKFTVKFSETYLKTIAALTDVHIDYTATITSDAVHSVNPENNTVTLEYQRNPQSNSDEDTTKVRDITNHYSFTIDGNLLGNDSYSATEVVKIGVSADGSEILERKTLANGYSVGALQGATFKLVYKKAGTGHAAGDIVVTKDKNGDSITWDENKIVSGADGRFTITGLDAGEYQLVEVKAPDGYIKMQTAIDVVIDTVVKPVTYVDEDGCTINTTELESYTVTIGGKETASYTITNSKDVTKAKSTKGDTVVGIDTSSGKIKNTKGVELPTTGGIGTTLFYLVGGILVLGAGILLVTRRKASEF